MSESLVAESAARIFTELADAQTINRATDESWKAPLWQSLEDSGLTLAWVSEEMGGAGASLADGFDIVSVAGRHGAPVAITETLLAGWLLEQAKLKSPSGPMTVAGASPGEQIKLNADGTLSGRSHRVPFSNDAKHFAVWVSAPHNAVALVSAADCKIGTERNLVRIAKGDVAFDGARPLAVGKVSGDFTQERLMLMGGVVRALQTAGALETALAMSVKYANERVAFGKPIGKFQAVQQNLARLAGETSAALTAATSAADTLINSERFDDGVFLEAVAAKIRCSEAARDGAAISHQVHGAIAFTSEYVLHRFTLRMLDWRDDFGNESYWAVQLGRRVAERGDDALWPLLASR